MKLFFSFLKKFSVITLVLVMVVGSVDAFAYAAVDRVDNTFIVEDAYENPLHYDMSDEGFVEIENGAYDNAVRFADENTPREIRESAINIRDNLIARNEVFQVTIDSPRTDFTTLVAETFRLAVSEELADTAVAGDYLAWQYKGYSYSGYAEGFDGFYRYTLNFKVTYYSTAKQEEQVAKAVEKALEELNIYELNDYDKIKSVYDYICKVCDYNYNAKANEYYNFSAYGAIIKGSAVCQGYSTLLYRMLKEAGIDNRIVTSTSHAWNIVRLEDTYYNVDVTWDDNYYNKGLDYKYFIKCEAHFAGHDREPQYKTEAFNNKYVMAKECYYEEAPQQKAANIAVCTQHNYEVTKYVAATCTKAGYRIYTCNECNNQKRVDIKALGHKIVVDPEVKATYAKEGKTQGTHCSVCKKVIVAQKKVAKLKVDGTQLKSLTAKSKGFKVVWNQQKNADGYEIEYSTNSNFNAKETKKATVSKNKTTSKAFSKLKGKKKYYIRVRAYKIYNGKKYYSSWSKVKNVNTKK